ncbi:hypothetical protein [Streptomyces sp. NPDC026673]|uniref:hypothetical protein n=1 Tax=Streptomyces sp. NPDC026673 TaxID=3155724 RepID=UPI0033E32E25
MISPTRPTTAPGGRLDRADGIARVLTATRPGIPRTARRDRTPVPLGITLPTLAALAGPPRALPPQPACGPSTPGTGGPR